MIVREIEERDYFFFSNRKRETLVASKEEMREKELDLSLKC